MLTLSSAQASFETWCEMTRAVWVASPPAIFSIQEGRISEHVAHLLSKASSKPSSFDDDETMSMSIRSEGEDAERLSEDFVFLL